MHLDDVGSLLDDLVPFVRRFVVVSEAQAYAIALWVVHTHCFEAADTTPYLLITSAEKRSGKTRLLEVLELVAKNPWMTGRTSVAAFIRALNEQPPPTLLFDEADAAFGGPKENTEALRGAFNTGFKRGGRATLCSGPNHELVHFSTFAAKAIAGIGKPPDTIVDRSIRIELTRRTRVEPVERFRRREVEPLALELVERLVYVAASSTEILRDARPELPDELDDRAQDVWEPLLAIADLASGEHPARARAAAINLSASATREDDSLGVKLLGDVRTVFDDAGVERLKSAEVTWALASIVDAPWGNWYGKMITAQAMANVLKPFGVRTRELWVEGKKERGYLRSQFEELWARYLPERAVGPVDRTEDAGPATATSPAPEPASLWDEPVPGTASTTPTGPTAFSASGDGPVCRYESHRDSVWLTRDGRRICGICHPNPDASTHL